MTCRHFLRPLSLREGVFASDTSELFELTMSEVDYTQSLLGNRWIGRGQIGLLVGPSGIGKSVVVMQMIAAWSCGKEALGIEPSGGPLSILLIQAEDDKNDLIHMAKGVTAGLGDKTLRNGDWCPEQYPADRVQPQRGGIRSPTR